ncbi:N-acetylmuramoyl-L-alanine amidase [Carnobacterium maltaromaticum]|uniref:N-acetylmuramoyl-L-alanine amidase n=1 Tax=Carnobacterium maltaromaticum TaxID=2751 RepID=UPI00295EC1A0|nr:N-acetylmuramoyl-L-alanine amidase [Carnobacterium maltaromaticum]
MTIKDTHAGHGGLDNFDPGAVNGTKQESKIARNINHLILTKTGAVDTTDNLATTVPQNLANIVNSTNRVASLNDWSISNHLNAASPGATGVEVFYFGADPVAKAKAEQAVNAMLNCFGYDLNNKPSTPAPTPNPVQPTSSRYPVGSIIVPKNNPNGMSYYVAAIGPLGYVIATGTRWADSSEFSTDRTKVRVGSVVQLKNDKFSYTVVNVRNYSDTRTEYLIATQVRDIAFDAVK